MGWMFWVGFVLMVMVRKIENEICIEGVGKFTLVLEEKE